MPLDHTSVCVVTGATSGIGAAIARRLAERGAQVAICGRSADRTAAAVESLGPAGRVMGTQCDVTDPNAVAALATWVEDRLGVPDVLINNAGLAYLAPLMDLTEAQIDEMFAVNVRGVFTVTRAFLPAMLERGSGDIINIASLSGKYGLPGGTGYAATKHAVLGFSKSLMLEVRQLGIRVMAICPGSVATPFFAKAGMDRTDLDQALQPDDIASTVVGAIDMPRRALQSEIDVRPAQPG